MSGKLRVPVRGFSIFIKFLSLVMAFFFAAACAFSSSQGDEAEVSTGKTESSTENPRALDVTVALAGSEPIFVSDYFSFVGADEKGHVAFAIDNDRARRGRKFFADAHVVLHDEHEGWVRVSGAGDYENIKKELLPIPDSPDFQFTGEVKSGITLHSPNNKLELEVAPVHDLVRRVRWRSDLYYEFDFSDAEMERPRHPGKGDLRIYTHEEPVPLVLRVFRFVLQRLSGALFKNKRRGRFLSAHLERRGMVADVRKGHGLPGH
jgi:hypothetical protein